LVAIILINWFRKKVLKKKDFPLSLVLVGGIAGILPDIDFLVYWLWGIFSGVGVSEIHGVYTHTLVVPVALLLIAVALWKVKKVAHVFLVSAAGYVIHLLLDSLFSTKPLFYPFSSVELGLSVIPSEILVIFYMSLDAVLLLLWLAYEWKYKKIRDYT
jgi:membrane-bound metal-dependent hydrolase YbcI (DUF457 family)